MVFGYLRALNEKRKMKEQIRAEGKADALEKRAMEAKKLRITLERQEKAKKEIAKLRKVKTKKYKAGLSGLKQGLKDIKAKRIEREASGGGVFGSSTTNIWDDKPKGKKITPVFLR